jgi:glycine hydroxymethyltransferase
MERIVDLMDTVLMNAENEAKIDAVKQEVNNWMAEVPLYK